MEPVIQAVCIAIDTKEIITNSTSLRATKIISDRFIKECTPPETFITGKYFMFIGGLIISFSTGGNPLIISVPISVGCSILKDL